MSGDRSDRWELRQAGTAIIAGVERCLPGWVEREVERILDAWGRLAPADRERARADAATAGSVAAARISDALARLLAAEPTEQTATPLEIVRTAYREPTELLTSLGVPAVVRDEFDERAWPDDRYGLVPRSLGELGDEQLAPLHLAWGLAKARAMRANEPE
jgi:hypothetical protein